MPVEVTAFQTALLGWYDAHARTLPWRSPPGTPSADPYRIWLSEVMLQQTTVAAVIPYFEAFTTRWPTVAALAAAEDGDVMQAWAGLGYYARARNLLACARAVTALGGFPTTEANLRTLPGIGAYTAAAVASIAFGEAAVVVDGNIERVMSRLFAVSTPIPAARPELRAHAAALTPTHQPGDHAQALMDLGATVCTPRSPRCDACPVARWCDARASGDPARFPVRAPKRIRPVRFGTAFRLEARGHVLLVRRPPRGLLGGMLALPTSAWTPAPVDWRTEAPVPADWTLRPTVVRHVFSHFELRLSVVAASLAARTHLPGEWWPADRLDEAGLPTLFAKASRA
ncbi:A/G-specific adenine glycosylase [Sphingosinicellaceae bacterium]|nr:A/G-specific adenine glycosylase [Sphingosinicellaceae bacterium]